MMAATARNSCLLLLEELWCERFREDGEDHRACLGESFGLQRGVLYQSVGPALLPVGKVSPFPTLSTKRFGLSGMVPCFLQNCYFVGAGPEAGQAFASHAESAILLPSRLAFFTESPKCGERRKESMLSIGGEPFQWLWDFPPAF